MNQRQLLVMWIGISIATLMIVFPPYEGVWFNGINAYGFFLSTMKTHINTAVLLCQLEIVALLTIGGILTLGKRSYGPYT